jgi:hypothetical protein
LRGVVRYILPLDLNVRKRHYKEQKSQKKNLDISKDNTYASSI